MRFALDPGGRVIEEHRGRLGAVKPVVAYRYDQLNRVEGERNGLASLPTRDYRHDELGKLILVTQPATTDHGLASTTFGYDANRNKVRQEDSFSLRTRPTVRGEMECPLAVTSCAMAVASPNPS